MQQQTAQAQDQDRNEGADENVTEGPPLLPHPDVVLQVMHVGNKTDEKHSE